MVNDQFQDTNGFHFCLTIAGSESQSTTGQDTAFQEVSGLSKELELEEVSSGGDSRFKFRLPEINKYNNLVLKRGICFKDSELIKWCMDTLYNGMAESIKPKNLDLRLLNSEGVSYGKWQFHGAYPVKWSVTELNSEKNAVLIETIELAYRFFDLVNTSQ